MKNIQLRQYQEADYEAVWQLHVDGLNQTGSFVFNPDADGDFKDINGIYLNNHGAFFVVEFNDQIVGMGALKQIDGNTAEIKRMRVRIEHQGQGIGTFILDRLIDKAKAFGYRKLIIDTSTKQIAAQRLYEKRGFRQYTPHTLENQNILYYELVLE